MALLRKLAGYGAMLRQAPTAVSTALAWVKAQDLYAHREYEAARACLGLAARRLRTPEIDDGVDLPSDAAPVRMNLLAAMLGYWLRDVPTTRNAVAVVVNQLRGSGADGYSHAALMYLMYVSRTLLEHLAAVAPAEAEADILEQASQIDIGPIDVDMDAVPRHLIRQFPTAFPGWPGADRWGRDLTVPSAVALGPQKDDIAR